MSLMYLPDAARIPLIPRPAYQTMIVAGAPQAFGRIVWVSDDKRTARVVWRGTPGTYAFSPDGRTIDVGVILSGRFIVRVPGEPDRDVRAGALVEFPRVPFEMEIIEEFTKVSFLYHPDGLTAVAEPLPD